MSSNKQPKKAKISVDLSNINSFEIFYSKKAEEIAINALPMMKLFMQMPPIEIRKHVIMFLNKELGWNLGKNILYKRKVGGKAQGGKLVIGSCSVESCTFQIVFQSTKQSQGFTVRPNRSNLTHICIAEDGQEYPCGCTVHVADQVSGTMLWYFCMVHLHCTSCFFVSYHDMVPGYGTMIWYLMCKLMCTISWYFCVVPSNCTVYFICM